MVHQHACFEITPLRKTRRAFFDPPARGGLKSHLALRHRIVATPNPLHVVCRKPRAGRQTVSPSQMPSRLTTITPQIAGKRKNTVYTNDTATNFVPVQNQFCR